MSRPAGEGVGVGPPTHSPLIVPFPRLQSRARPQTSILFYPEFKEGSSQSSWRSAQAYGNSLGGRGVEVLGGDLGLEFLRLMT